ncbi:unnamed protein product, partial [Didymodactylos carnosus]
MCASLYDEDELDEKEIAKTITVDQPQQPWGDSIRLLQAQLHTKKLQQHHHQTKKELKGGGTVAPVADLRKRRLPRFGPGPEVSFNSMTGKMEVHDQKSSENISSNVNTVQPQPVQQQLTSIALLTSITTNIPDEYDPLKPNDYEKLKEQKRRQQQRERDEERRQQDEEDHILDYEKEKERDREAEERLKKGAAFAPPPSLIEEDKRSSLESTSNEVMLPPPNLKDRVERMDTSPARTASPSNVTLPPPSLPPPSLVNPFGASAAAKIMAKMGYKEGQGLGKSQQGMSQALVVEKTSKRGGKILHEKELPLKQGNNMVGGGEVDEMLEGETKEECQKYGEVEKVVIFEIPDSPDEEAVRIFVEFKRVESAVKAVVDLNGRYFAGRVKKISSIQPFTMDGDDTKHLDDDAFIGNAEDNTQDSKNTPLEDSDWINELRHALDGGCDLGSIRNIGKCRPLNNELRLRVWQTCLNINTNTDEYKYVNEVFDLPEQNTIREDALRLVQSLNLNEQEAASKMNDVEAIITSYCKQ